MIIEHNQQLEGQRLLTSIAKHGITKKPQARRGITSLTEGARDTKLCYNHINLDQVNANKAFDSITNEVGCGLLPVAMERSTVQMIPDMLEDAALNSIVFIFKPPSHHLQHDANIFRKPIYDDPITARCNPLSNDTHFTEIAEMGLTIDMSQVQAVMVPYHLITSVRASMPGIPILPIPVKKITLVQTPLMLIMQQAALCGRECLVPNYALGLRQFTHAFPQVRQLGIHIVRMPLPMTPLAHGLESKSYNQQYIALNLTKPNEYLLANLKRQFSDAFIFKSERSKWRIVCPPAQKQAIIDAVGQFDQKLTESATTIQSAFRALLARRAFVVMQQRDREQPESMPDNGVQVSPA